MNTEIHTEFDADAREIKDPAKALRFVLGGNAYFTVRSERTQDRITFRVAKAQKRLDDEDDRWFVSFLKGPSNTNPRDYSYLGMIVANKNGVSYQFVRTQKSPGTDTKQFMAFRYFFERIEDGLVPCNLSFWHMGRCARCARMLTVPSSVESGFGPECINKV